MVRKAENIAIIHEHYHVTDAGIRLLLESLSGGIAKYFGPAAQYLWYSPQKFQGRTKPREYFSHKFVTLIEDEALGYLTDSFDSSEQFEAAVVKRKNSKLEVIRRKFKDHDAIVHIVQNPTLLKNPVETQANARMAGDLLDRHYLQIWHIHDLLEDSTARQALRDAIKTIAGKETEKTYGCNGCGIAWTTSPNIFYAVINLRDRSALEAFFPFELKKTLFYFPDPVDTDMIRTPPAYERNGDTIDDRIIAYCESHREHGYAFDPDANILVAAEFARERKNTGEQILLLKLLNTLSPRTGRKFQLLITLIPTMGKDADRINIFEEYIRINKMPVVMGFGSQVLARGHDDDNERFSMTDLWCHPKAYLAVSTSVKEGFGYNFINPAVATVDQKFTLTTVGRRLREIFPDFGAAGLCMHDDAFYDTIMMDASVISSDLAALNKEKTHIIRDKLPRSYKAISYDGVIPLGKDFARYSAHEQVLLMDVIDYVKLSKRMSGFIEFVLDRDRMNRVAKTNAEAIMESFSLKAYIGKFRNMIEKAFVYKRERLCHGERPTMIDDNSYLIDYYRQQPHP